ncbi:MAG TPA: DinB family protein [Dehalococcoidia bacterium]|nr:DinB family protein [Dehalococcoidia bacterium]
MATSKLVGLVFEAWNDMDRVVDGLDAAEAVHRIDGGSSFAWTVAHATNQVDLWLNVRFAAHTPHPLVSQAQFRAGASGTAEDWGGIKSAIAEARALARDYLQDLDEPALDVVVPYDGSVTALRETGLSPRHALLRISAHHYFHIGEIATKPDQLGHRVGDYPGALTQAI